MTARAASVHPDATEHASYYGRYIALVPEADVLETLRSQLGDTLRMLENVGDARAAESYEEGKWSIKEVLGHVIDSERIFAYRALRFARGDTTELPGYEQDDFVRRARFNARSLEDLVGELEAVRAATVALFQGFDDAEMMRRGIANDVVFSVRALAYIIAGHELHHRRILRERYGLAS